MAKVGYATVGPGGVRIPGSDWLEIGAVRYTAFKGISDDLNDTFINAKQAMRAHPTCCLDPTCSLITKHPEAESVLRLSGGELSDTVAFEQTDGVRLFLLRPRPRVVQPSTPPSRNYGNQVCPADSSASRQDAANR